MTSTHTRTLDIPTLPPTACIQHLFPEMKTTGLLSIGQLCDHGCTAKFSRTKLVIRNSHGTIIMVGYREHRNKMWMVNVQNNKPHKCMMQGCNAIILSDTTKNDLAKFHHVSLGNPVKLTLIGAIDKGFLATFPGLTRKLAHKFLPKSEATVKGHMDQE